MADAVLLTQETYDRIMKIVHDYEAGYLTIIPGEGLRIDEIGKDGTKISIDGTECP
jgi:hypothetical protein